MNTVGPIILGGSVPRTVGYLLLDAVDARSAESLVPARPREVDDAEIEYVAARLRSALHGACAGDGASPREKVLVARWGIDRSVVGRVVRALRTEDAMAFLRHLPSPEGLTLVLEGARRAGAGEPALGELRGAVDAWSGLIERYPGKRRGLMLRGAAATPADRERADLAARRMMFQQASEFMGYEQRHSVATMFVYPSENRDRLHTMHVLGKFGLRRTRADGGPITVMGLAAGPEAPSCSFLPIDEGLRGDRAEDCVLRRYCRGRAQIELVRTPARAIEMRLPRSEPALHAEIDVVCGQRIPDMLLARRTPALSYEWYEVLPRIPMRALTVDVVLHESVYPGVVPLVTGRLFSPNPPTPPHAEVPESDAIRTGARVELLPPGMVSMGIPDVHDYPGMVRAIAESRGLVVAQFRTIRMTVAFPVLMASTTLWFPLPD